MKRETDKNLIPTNQRTKEEARELGRKGGIASGETRRRKRTMKERIQAFSEATYHNDEGETEISGITGDNICHAEQWVKAQSEKADKGDTKAFQALMDILGEKTTNMNVNGNVDVGEKRDKKLANVPDELLEKVAQHIKKNDE